MHARAARHRRLSAPQLDERIPEPLGILGVTLDVPLVTEVLTLVNGLLTTSTKTVATPTTPATTPATTPTPTSTPSSGGGGSGTGAGSGAGAGAGAGAGGSGSGSSDDSGSSGAAGSSGSDSGDSSGANPSSGGANPTTTAPGTTPSAGSSSGNTGAVSDGADGSSGGFSPTNVLVAHTGGVANAGGDPSGQGAAVPTGSVSYIVESGTTVGAVVGSVTLTGTAIPTTPPGSSSDPGSAASNGSAKHGVPKYVAGVVGVLGAFVLLGLVVFTIRRRAMSKRAKRRTWWTGLRRSDSDSDASGRWGSDHATHGGGTGESATTRSIRSSFGTTFDHSEFEITFDDCPPPPAIPPMVEIRDSTTTTASRAPLLALVSPISPGSPSTLLAQQPQTPLLVHIENSPLFSDANRRASAGSSNSAQYLNYDRASGAANPGLEGVATPMSVRPFSPTESFAFPVPPRASTVVSPTAVEAILIPQTPVHVQTETFPQIMADPFADAFAAPLAAAAATQGGPTAEFEAVEMIYRPFERTLQDELSVRSGDRVRVLAVYDDGWAMVETQAAPGDDKGKGKGQIGLIPIDCMRKADESVQTFLAKKRVESRDVDATGYAGMAV